MTSELSFLLDLLLNHKLPSATKVAVSERIKEVEQRLSSAPVYPSVTRVTHSSSSPIQAPSTQAILDRNPDLLLTAPVINIAQTPAAAAALASREQAIAESMAGKVNKETGRPRKF